MLLTPTLPTVRAVALTLCSAIHGARSGENPWGGAPRPLPETLATMTPQAYNAIRYDEKQSLWNNIEGRQLDAQFFHMGMGFRRRVHVLAGSNHLSGA